MQAVRTIEETPRWAFEQLSYDFPDVLTVSDIDALVDALDAEMGSVVVAAGAGADTSNSVSSAAKPLTFRISTRVISGIMYISERWNSSVPSQEAAQPPLKEGGVPGDLDTLRATDDANGAGGTGPGENDGDEKPKVSAVSATASRDTVEDKEAQAAAARLCASVFVGMFTKLLSLSPSALATSLDALHPPVEEVLPGAPVDDDCDDAIAAAAGQGPAAGSVTEIEEVMAAEEDGDDFVFESMDGDGDDSGIPSAIPAVTTGSDAASVNDYCEEAVISKLSFLASFVHYKLFADENPWLSYNLAERVVAASAACARHASPEIRALSVHFVMLLRDRVLANPGSARARTGREQGIIDACIRVFGPIASEPSSSSISSKKSTNDNNDDTESAAAMMRRGLLAVMSAAVANACVGPSGVVTTTPAPEVPPVAVMAGGVDAAVLPILGLRLNVLSESASKMDWDGTGAAAIEAAQSFAIELQGLSALAICAAIGAPQSSPLMLQSGIVRSISKILKATFSAEGAVALCCRRIATGTFAVLSAASPEIAKFWKALPMFKESGTTAALAAAGMAAEATALACADVMAPQAIVVSKDSIAAAIERVDIVLKGCLSPCVQTQSAPDDPNTIVVVKVDTGIDVAEALRACRLVLACTMTRSNSAQAMAQRVPQVMQRLSAVRRDAQVRAQELLRERESASRSHTEPESGNDDDDNEGARDGIPVSDHLLSDKAAAGRAAAERGSLVVLSGLIRAIVGDVDRKAD